MVNRLRFGAMLASLFLAFSFVAVDHADARRGGSFGSRGFRTFQSAPTTTTAPKSFAPVQRSMTPGQAAQPGTGTAQNGATTRRPGLFGGLGGGLLGGLMLGGLFGMLMGTGFGGMGGFLALLVQVLLIALGASLLMRLFRNRAGGAYAGNSGAAERRAYEETPRPAGPGSFRIPSIGSGAGLSAGSAAASSGPADEIGITDRDLDAFEQTLQEVQAAFSREDYAALRQITTPEVMSYLAEELSENATSGRKNDVTAVTLLQGDVAEAWREEARDYASVAMRFESINVMRDRQSGAVVEGDPEHPSETTELWTFVRENGGAWKLSAIQAD
ncbi:MAG TPA: hypothetical protein ENH55_12005 [Aurantimonas coralicida]|uniref:Tim44-like domain-containing protein n=2 Tax=root TaxID=1 RepID=A0A9C9NHL6_9HYPH|nr:hypothetical protein [Aurantimonas coralicida]HEU01408.1 hypothetical protein [Aurantimonas coralicida]